MVVIIRDGGSREGRIDDIAKGKEGEGDAIEHFDSAYFLDESTTSHHTSKNQDFPKLPKNLYQKHFWKKKNEYKK